MLDEARAADLLALQPKTLCRWRWEGKGPVYCKIGGAIRYPLDELQAFIDDSKVMQHD